MSRKDIHQGIPVIVANGCRKACFADVRHAQVGLLRLLFDLAFHFCSVCGCLSLVLSKQFVDLIAVLLLRITAQV